MAAKRLPMRKLREILRLKYEAKLAHRAIAQACFVGVGTVSQYVKRAQEAGLGWPLPGDLDDGALEEKLFRGGGGSSRDRPKPDLPRVHEELKRPGVTLQLLWEEYRAVHKEDGYAYSRFCELYGAWAKKLKVSMRHEHRAGEKTFVDFSGKKPCVVDPQTGEEKPVELFVGVLGASSYTYAVATRSQKLPDWIRAHQGMAEYFSGSSEIWVPDNLRSGISKPCRYEPEVNRTYQELAAHYSAVVIPARALKAKDKAKVEVGVQVAQRWILARLRNRTFFSLAELNQAIQEQLENLNGRPMRHLGASRRELFERLDRPALKPLPAGCYELAEWKPCRVNIDYHVQVSHSYYSVPYQLVGEKIEARSTSQIVELYFKNRRVASHQRVHARGRYVTQKQHMPHSHREHAQWTPSRLIGWAERGGPSTGDLVTRILHSRPHPEQGYRACLGLMRLGRQYGAGRLEAACARALFLCSYSYRTVKNSLSSGSDRLPLEEPQSSQPTPNHDNIRGADYYAAQEEAEC